MSIPVYYNIRTAMHFLGGRFEIALSNAILVIERVKKNEGTY